MMKKIKTAVIGTGYLGKFHAQKYASLANSELLGVCDINGELCQDIAKQCNVPAYTDYHELIGKVDAVSIAVPTLAHYEVTKVFLENGIHVLLEKPITPTVNEAEILIEIANQKNLVFQIGHLERFNPALKALEGLLDNPRFIESFRLAPFKLRGSEVNVVLDMMIHDIDIIQNIMQCPIAHIDASGACVLSHELDIVNARLQFANGAVANVTASRVSIKTERKLRIFQHNAYLSLDLQDKKLTCCRKGTGEMFPGVPDIISDEKSFEQSDSLRDEIIAFLDAITHNTAPIISGEHGKAALATAIEITNIIHGQAK